MILRLQPPLDEERFVGKVATPEIILEYIGNLQAICENGKMTLDEYYKLDSEYINSHRSEFLTLFPYEIQDLALIYLRQKAYEPIKH